MALKMPRKCPRTAFFVREWLGDMGEKKDPQVSPSLGVTTQGGSLGVIWVVVMLVLFGASLIIILVADEFQGVFQDFIRSPAGLHVVPVFLMVVEQDD